MEAIAVAATGMLSDDKWDIDWQGGGTRDRLSVKI